MEIAARRGSAAQVNQAALGTKFSVVEERHSAAVLSTGARRRPTETTHTRVPTRPRRYKVVFYTSQQQTAALYRDNSANTVKTGPFI